MKTVKTREERIERERTAAHLRASFCPILGSGLVMPAAAIESEYCASAAGVLSVIYGCLSFTAVSFIVYTPTEVVCVFAPRRLERVWSASVYASARVD